MAGALPARGKLTSQPAITPNKRCPYWQRGSETKLAGGDTPSGVSPKCLVASPVCVQCSVQRPVYLYLQVK